MELDLRSIILKGEDHPPSIVERTIRQADGTYICLSPRGNVWRTIDADGYKPISGWWNEYLAGIELRCLEPSGSLRYSLSMDGVLKGRGKYHNIPDVMILHGMTFVRRQYIPDEDIIPLFGYLPGNYSEEEKFTLLLSF